MKKKAVARRKEPPKLKPPAKPIKKVTLEINTNRIEESISQAVDQIQYWYQQGLIRKIRLKYKGKAILPDIPLSYFLLAQAATFFLAGIVRAIAISIGTKVFFEVEMVNDADERFKRAKELYLEGELDDAVTLFQEVLELDSKHAEACLYLGIIHKIRKDPDSAAKYFQRAHKLDPSGRTGVEATKKLKKLASPVE